MQIINEKEKYKRSLKVKSRVKMVGEYDDAIEDIKQTRKDKKKGVKK